MRISGTVTKIIPSRCAISFGGFISLTKDDSDFESIVSIFKKLSRRYNFYCNHVVLEIKYFNDTYYIGYNDGVIDIGNSYHVIAKEDKRDFIEVNNRLSYIRRKL